jgi:hypothetical protein
MIGSWYFPALWATVLAGLIPGIFFVATFRPRWARLGEGLDVGGWIVVIVLLYLRQAILLLVGLKAPTPEIGLINLGFGVAIDALLWMRALRWHRLRSSRGDPGNPRRRSSD